MAGVEAAVAYAAERTQFGQPIAGFQLVQAKLATMVAETTAMQLICLQLAQLQDRGAMTGPMASLAKLHNARKAKLVCSEARDIMGGNGLLLEYHVARHLTDLEIVETYEGTDSVQSLILGRDVTGRLGLYVGGAAPPQQPGQGAVPPGASARDLHRRLLVADHPEHVLLADRPRLDHRHDQCGADLDALVRDQAGEVEVAALRHRASLHRRFWPLPWHARCLASDTVWVLIGHRLPVHDSRTVAPPGRPLTTMPGRIVAVAPTRNDPHVIVDVMRPSAGRTTVAVAVADAPPTSVAR